MWNEVYNTEQYVYGKEPNGFLADHLQDLTPGRILCIGDGEGRNSVFLARQGWQVTAVDLSEVALVKAKRLAEEAEVNIQFIHADLAEFDFGHEQWDGVVAIFCHLPAPIRTQVHRGIIHGLKVNGRFLIEGYTPAQLNYHTGGPSNADMMLTYDILLDELSELSVMMLEEQVRPIHEGIKHHGQGAIVHGIFKKTRSLS